MAPEPDTLTTIAAGLRLALSQMLPGSELCYYTGNLMAERVREEKRAGHSALLWPVEPIDTIARVMQSAADEGLVELVQRRVGPGATEYLARKPVALGSHFKEPRVTAAGRVG